MSYSYCGVCHSDIHTVRIRETQDMVDFCAFENIKPEIEKIAMTGIDEAWSKVIAKKARYRFVIDIKGQA